jgi:ribosome-binding factor A
MPSQRMQRVRNLLRAEISTIMLRRLKDPRVSMATITDIDVAPDLKNARVYVSVYGDRPHQDEALEGLKSAAGFVRAELMKALDLRPMPHLEFELDESLARGAHTLDLLDQVLQEERPLPPGSEPGDATDQEQ